MVRIRRRNGPRAHSSVARVDKEALEKTREDRLGRGAAQSAQERRVRQLATVALDLPAPGTGARRAHGEASDGDRQTPWRYPTEPLDRVLKRRHRASSDASSRSAFWRQVC